MAPPTFTVNYPRGFPDKCKSIGSGVRVNNYTNNEVERYGRNNYSIPSTVSETSITLPLETLISTFNIIINKYKLNPDTYLALNKISEILTTEESVVKYALVKLNGTQGRSLIIINNDPSASISYPTITYNPNLKDTKKYLLTLFNRFLNYKDKNKEDIVMYEGQPLFIHLFAIIIDSFHFPNPEVLIKKDCTDTFAMITLLELLLNKKHKNILNFHINNIPLPKVEVDETLNNDDNSEDDDWDREDFEPFKYSQLSSVLPPLIPSVIPSVIPSITIIKPIIEDYNYTKINNISNPIPNKITDDIPDDWDSL